MSSPGEFVVKGCLVCRRLPVPFGPIPYLCGKFEFEFVEEIKKPLSNCGISKHDDSSILKALVVVGFMCQLAW